MFGIGRNASSSDAWTTVDVLPRTIGFHPPPTALRVSWEKRRRFWEVRIRPLKGSFADADQVQRWADSFRPVSIEGNGSLVRMRLDRLPPEWESLDNVAEVLHVELGQDGASGRLYVRSTTAGLEAVKRAEREGRPFILDRFAPIQRPRLTARQRYLLHSALDWGYYDVPRRITLERMATRLGVGLNTLSVVLRNAEAALVRNFVTFDEKPLPSARLRGSRSNGA